MSLIERQPVSSAHARQAWKSEMGRKSDCITFSSVSSSLLRSAFSELRSCLCRLSTFSCRAWGKAETVSVVKCRYYICSYIWDDEWQRLNQGIATEKTWAIKMGRANLRTFKAPKTEGRTETARRVFVCSQAINKAVTVIMGKLASLTPNSFLEEGETGTFWGINNILRHL